MTNAGLWFGLMFALALIALINWKDGGGSND